MTRPPERLKNMKLPTATFPASFREMRRQSVRPLKRLSGRLIRNIQSSVETKLGNKNPFETLPSTADIEDSKGSKVLLNLLLVRPWVLVLAFWLLSMATGTLALNGMLSPRKLKMALPEPALDSGSSTQANTLLNAGQASGSAEGSAESSTPDGFTSEPAVIEIGASANADESDSGFPVLPVLALVGSCAAGSLLISRRRAMIRLAAARAQVRKRRSRPVSGSSSRVGREETAAGQTAAAGASHGTKHKKRRQRVRKAVTAQSAGNGSRVLASRATTQQQKTAQQKAAQPRKVQTLGPKVVQKVVQKTVGAKRSSGRSAARSHVRPATRVSRTQVRRAAMRTASRRQPMVSVVPANESHALDWTQGSLAHQMDVRPHRSAM